MAAIDRANALSLINQQNASEIWQLAPVDSAALRTFRKITMTSKQTKMPVIDALPVAAFITGDTGLKPTSNMIWANKILEAEELAVIVPIPENVFEDTSYSVWGEVRPRIAESVGAGIDGAVFFGTNIPASWPLSLEDGARAAGNIYSLAAAGDIVEDINQTMSIVELDGFDPNVVYSRTRIRAKLRGLRDTTNQPILVSDFVNNVEVQRVYGLPLELVRNNTWIEPTALDEGPPEVPAAGAELIIGDRNMAILGMRQDITYKILTEATLLNPDNTVMFSLAQSDMIALRAKMRVGFQVADPTTIEGGSSAYPFAVLGA